MCVCVFHNKIWDSYLTKNSYKDFKLSSLLDASHIKCIVSLPWDISVVGFSSPHNLIRCIECVPWLII